MLPVRARSEYGSAPNAIKAITRFLNRGVPLRLRLEQAHGIYLGTERNSAPIGSVDGNAGHRE